MGGNHIHVDIACPPRKKLKGENALLYDSKRTVFIGNFPFDVKDEGLYQLFSSFNNLKDCIEAIRVMRPECGKLVALNISTSIDFLQLWNLVFSMPAGEDLDTPYSLKRSEEVVLDQELKVDGPLPDKLSCCQGVFYNYFSIGLRSRVALNLHSYASGRNPWGNLKPEYLEKNGFVEARADDGVLEVFGFKHGWHASFVMVELILAKHIRNLNHRSASIYNESARMKAQGQDDLRFEGLTKDISKVKDLIAMIYCNR
ncbi:diacylglycerol kinase 4-like protein [Tanacetum coccineum]